MSTRRTAAGLAAVSLLLTLAAPGSAAQQQKQNIVGDSPEPGSNNWLYPLGPAANPFHRPEDPAFPTTQLRARLGKLIFWDEQLSSDSSMSCGTCHFPEAGGTDPRAGAFAPNGNTGSLGMLPQGLQGQYGDGATGGIDRLVTGVTAPSMIGAYVFNQLFWDLRAGPALEDDAGMVIAGFLANAGLEAQAVGPPVSNIEMAHAGMRWGSGEIQAKLGGARPLALATPASIPPDVAPLVASGSTYDALFDLAFGGSAGVTRERVAQAIAHYERTLVPNQAPIDLPNGMTPAQKRGFDLMRSSGCMSCHSATGLPALDAANNIVDPFDQPLSDGLAHFINLPAPGNVNGFVKTPSLRNLGLRKRFFHSGQFDDIDDVLAFYNRELGLAIFPFFPALTPAEKADVRDFLVNALTDPRVASAKFPFDRPDLYSERVPFETNEFGAGTPGASGLAPEILANAPPSIGSSAFKLGVGRGPAGARALLTLSLESAAGPVIWVGAPAVAPQKTVLDAQGIGTVQLQLPASSELIGLRLHAQWHLRDPGAPAGFSTSNAAFFDIF